MILHGEGQWSDCHTQAERVTYETKSDQCRRIGALLVVQPSLSIPFHNLPANYNERALVQRARAGAPDAIAELYQRHCSAVYRYFYFRAQDHCIAEDLVGEVFLQMVEALPRYVDQGKPFTAWLFRIARHRMIDYYRRTRVARAAVECSGPAETHEGSETTAMRRLEHHLLHRRINELTDEQKTVVQLRFFEGYSLNDVAAIVGKSATAVKALQHRALQRLAQTISP